MGRIKIVLRKDQDSVRRFLDVLAKLGQERPIVANGKYYLVRLPRRFKEWELRFLLEEGIVESQGKIRCLADAEMRMHLQEEYQRQFPRQQGIIFATCYVFHPERVGKVGEQLCQMLGAGGETRESFPEA